MIISIITPCYNSEVYLEQTILSVVYQDGPFFIEYIIVDGASNDSTLEIIKKYEDLISNGKSIYFEGHKFHKPSFARCKGIILKFISEPDQGMYDAINKGFGLSNGFILAYINSDDLYDAEAFKTACKIFQTNKDIHWIKGRTDVIGERNISIYKCKNFLYDQNWIKKGIYGQKLFFIQQEGIFWRRWLWIKAGKIDSKYKLAGDYYLWFKFADHAKLWSVDMNFAFFRKHGKQLSADLDGYLTEMNDICPADIKISEKLDIYFKKRFRHKFTKYLYQLVHFRTNYYFLKLIPNDENMRFEKKKFRFYDFIPRLKK
ncbi:MAG: glycosyltransferase family 2 protein [Candidatus Kapaibacterium sp.]